MTYDITFPQLSGDTSDIPKLENYLRKQYQLLITEYGANTADKLWDNTMRIMASTNEHQALEKQDISLTNENIKASVNAIVASTDIIKELQNEIYKLKKKVSI